MASGEAFEFAAPDDTRLRGTLERPSVPGTAPAALLLNGSGPLDRDSNMPGQSLNVANALADALGKRGIASLRYDKRGIGESQGDYLQMSFEDETEDARAALAALRGAPNVDPARLFVIGHSVGATIAIRLAAERGDLAGIVLLAAAARRGEEVMVVQSERIVASLGRSGLRSRLLLRRQARARRRLLTSTGDVVRVGLNRLPARWFREFMVYDPTPDLRLIECPLLAITGGRDLQVEPEDVAAIGRLVRGPFTGSTPDRLTHVLRLDEGVPGLAGYPTQLRKPIDPELVEQVVSWVAARAEDRRP